LKRLYAEQEDITVPRCIPRPRAGASLKRSFDGKRQKDC